MNCCQNLSRPGWRVPRVVAKGAMKRKNPEVPAEVQELWDLYLLQVEGHLAQLDSQFHRRFAAKKLRRLQTYHRGFAILREKARLAVSVFAPMVRSSTSGGITVAVLVWRPQGVLRLGGSRHPIGDLRFAASPRSAQVTVLIF